MLDKIERYNNLILEELALALNQEAPLPQALITITYVNCSSDLKQAKIGFSVLPDRLAGTALRHLKAANTHLVAILKKRLKLRQFPHLIWQFDSAEREAKKIESLLKSA